MSDIAQALKKEVEAVASMTEKDWKDKDLTVLDTGYLVSSGGIVEEVHLLLAFNGPTILAEVTSDGHGVVKGTWGGFEEVRYMKPSATRAAYKRYEDPPFYIIT